MGYSVATGMRRGRYSLCMKDKSLYRKAKYEIGSSKHDSNIKNIDEHVPGRLIFNLDSTFYLGIPLNVFVGASSGVNIRKSQFDLAGLAYLRHLKLTLKGTYCRVC